MGIRTPAGARPHYQFSKLTPSTAWVFLRGAGVMITPLENLGNGFLEACTTKWYTLSHGTRNQFFLIGRLARLDGDCHHFGWFDFPRHNFWPGFQKGKEIRGKACRSEQQHPHLHYRRPQGQSDLFQRGLPGEPSPIQPRGFLSPFSGGGAKESHQLGERLARWCGRRQRFP